MRQLIGIGSIVIALPLVVAASLLPRSLFYRNRRPTPFGKWTNRVMGAWYGTGATPGLMSTLEVRRRRSAEWQRVPIVIAKHDGHEYLVSMLGEESEWVKNVRAADGHAVLRHGRMREVDLELVPVEQRAPIIKAYLGRAIGARPHIPVRPDAPLGEFERVAGAYPVFRIGPASPSGTAAG